MGAIQEFVADRSVSGFPHIVDETGDIWAGFDVRGQPAFVFINDDGSVYGPFGSLDPDELAEMLEELVNT